MLNRTQFDKVFQEFWLQVSERVKLKNYPRVKPPSEDSGEREILSMNDSSLTFRTFNKHKKIRFYSLPCSLFEFRESFWLFYNWAQGRGINSLSKTNYQGPNDNRGLKKLVADLNPTSSKQVEDIIRYLELKIPVYNDFIDSLSDPQSAPLQANEFANKTEPDAESEASLSEPFASPEEEAITGTEGRVSTITVNRYERAPKLRAECIRIQGLSCAVCEMTFEQRYGEIGKGFIHVHHLRPLGSVKEEHEVDPANHLAPVCPNCHAMLHQRRPEPFTIEEMRAILRDAS